MNNNKQKVKDILSKYNLRTIKKDNNVSSIQLNDKKTKTASPPTTYTIPNPKNIIKITPDSNTINTNPQKQTPPTKINEQPISIQNIINNDRKNEELLTQKMKTTMPTAILPSNVKIKPNIYDFIPTVQEPVFKENIIKQQPIVKEPKKIIPLPENNLKTISMAVPNNKNNISNNFISPVQKVSQPIHNRIDPLLYIPKKIENKNINNTVSRPSSTEYKQVFIDKKLNEDQSQTYNGISNNTNTNNTNKNTNTNTNKNTNTNNNIIKVSKPVATNVIRNEEFSENTNDESIKTLERKRHELIKIQNEELSKLKQKKEQIIKLNNKKKEIALLKSIEVEKQKLLKIQQQKNKITTLLHSNTQSNTQPVVTVTKPNIQNKQPTPIISNNKTLSSYDKINNLNTNSIFKKKEKPIPDVIEPITLPKDTKIETTHNSVKPKAIIKDKKTNDSYPYYTKKDFPNLNWDIDKKCTSTLEFINNIKIIKIYKQTITFDEQCNLLKSTYSFKHLDKLKETDKIKLPKLINCLYNILFTENFIIIKSRT